MTPDHIALFYNNRIDVSPHHFVPRLGNQQPLPPVYKIPDIKKITWRNGRFLQPPKQKIKDKLGAP
jgi:hypothetical protein